MPSIWSLRDHCVGLDRNRAERDNAAQQMGFVRAFWDLQRNQNPPGIRWVNP